MRSCCSRPMRCFMWTKPILNRRQMLQRMCAGFGLVGLGGLLDPQAVFASGANGVPHFAPRAKRAIFLFLNGAPPHVDTSDPEPALREYEGRHPNGELYKKPKGTASIPRPFACRQSGQSGIEVSERLPNLAR